MIRYCRMLSESAKSQFLQLKSVNNTPCRTKPVIRPSSMSVKGCGILPGSWDEESLTELDDSDNLKLQLLNLFYQCIQVVFK